MSDESEGLSEFYDTRTEYCPECDEARNHHVNITVKTESEDYGGNQPYRIRECQVCGNIEENRVGMGD